MLNANEVKPMPDTEPDIGFWQQTTILTHIHKSARSRGANPYATLGCVLRRTIGCIEPHVVLPATVGGQVSLNLFTAPVGASGAGKDIANAAGHDACDFHWGMDGIDTPVNDATHVHPGTGEGLARIFKDGETRAHLQMPDVAALEALAARKGQTLVSQLLHAYMGQPIGFRNNSKETTTAVEEHAYRLCLSVGVQPENAGFFLSREKDGFPQRFLWLPTLDPYALPDRPDDPVPAQSITLPQFKLKGRDRFVMPIPPEVADEIWYVRWLVNTGAEGVDPLDTHLKLTQLKVAAAVAILHGDDRVTGDWWKIAAQLIDVSNTVRAGLQAAVAARNRRENTARAHDQADREAIIRERLSEDSQQRVAKAITRKLTLVGAATKYDLRMACTSSIRADFPTVFDLFIDKAFLVCCEGGDGHATQYRLAAK